MPTPAENLVSNKRNPFSVGDAVFHPNSGRRGLVKEVSTKWVKFDVFGVTLPGGKTQTVRYSYRTLLMVATRQQMYQKALAMKQAADAAEAVAKTPVGRLVRFAKKVFPFGKTQNARK